MDIKPKFRLVIAGSRSFSDLDFMRERCDQLLVDKRKSHDIVVVSGTAGGADKLGERYASEQGFEVDRFPADWDRYGKSGGMVRNKQMLESADGVIVFWDGLSRGSKHMMDITKGANKPLRVVRFCS